MAMWIANKMTDNDFKKLQIIIDEMLEKEINLKKAEKLRREK